MMSGMTFHLLDVFGMDLPNAANFGRGRIWFRDPGAQAVATDLHTLVARLNRKPAVRKATRMAKRGIPEAEIVAKLGPKVAPVLVEFDAMMELGQKLLFHMDRVTQSEIENFNAEMKRFPNVDFELSSTTTFGRGDGLSRSRPWHQRRSKQRRQLKRGLRKFDRKLTHLERVAKRSQRRMDRMELEPEDRDLLEDDDTLGFFKERKARRKHAKRRRSTPGKTRPYRQHKALVVAIEEFDALAERFTRRWETTSSPRGVPIITRHSEQVYPDQATLKADLKAASQHATVVTGIPVLARIDRWVLDGEGVPDWRATFLTPQGLRLEARANRKIERASRRLDLPEDDADLLEDDVGLLPFLAPLALLALPNRKKRIKRAKKQLAAGQPVKPKLLARLKRDRAKMAAKIERGMKSEKRKAKFQRFIEQIDAILAEAEPIAPQWGYLDVLAPRIGWAIPVRDPHKQGADAAAAALTALGYTIHVQTEDDGYLLTGTGKSGRGKTVRLRGSPMMLQAANEAASGYRLTARKHRKGIWLTCTGPRDGLLVPA